MPLLLTCFVAAWLDRVNVGFAALTTNRDIHRSSTTFGTGASIFFLPYFILGVPSNLAPERFGARRWIARIRLSWGLVSAAIVFVEGEKILLSAASRI